MAKDAKKDSRHSSFLLTSKNCRKTSYQLMYFDHIEATMKYCIDGVQIFQFASEDITRIIRSRFLGKQNAVPWDGGSRHRGIVQESLQLLWSPSAPQLQSTHPWKSNQIHSLSRHSYISQASNSRLNNILQGLIRFELP
jgi:hypothetical protein